MSLKYENQSGKKFTTGTHRNYSVLLRKVCTLVWVTFFLIEVQHFGLQRWEMYCPGAEAQAAWRLQPGQGLAMAWHEDVAQQGEG